MGKHCRSYAVNFPNPDNQHTDSTLASITALYMYEVSFKVIPLQKGIDDADTGFKTERLDAACKWSWTAFGVERPMGSRSPMLGKAFFLEHRIMLVRNILLCQV